MGLSDFISTRTRRASLIVCAANAVFFCALLAAYFYLKHGAKDWPQPFHFASLLMACSMTMFAVSGSGTAAMAAHAAKMGDKEPAVRWLALAISSWLVFLFLEIIEWVRLVYMLQIGWHTAFGQTFLSLTVAHWICVFAGAMWLMYVVMDTQRRDVLAAGIYSHFLNAVWLVLLVVLYFGNADLEGL